VTVTIREAEGATEVTVHNEGPPIPPEKMAIIFDPFRQGSFEANQTAHGLGLGLYIADQVVRAHQGSITATSGFDTTFTVTLPSVRPGAEAVKPAGGSVVGRGPRADLSGAGPLG
jgi:signal transduction histidine kinase